MKNFIHKHILLENQLKEVTVDGKRFYETPGGIFPSVTTVTGWEKQNFFAEWRRKNPEESKRVTVRGTKFHGIIEDYLNNKELDFENMIPNYKVLFNLLKPELDKIDNITAIETPLWSKILGLAGRTDCIAEYDGVLSVIDFKTSSKIKKKEDIPDYFAQCVCYATMYEELIGTPINQIVVIMAVQESEPLVFIEKTEDHIDNLTAHIKFYKDSLDKKSRMQ